MRRHKKRVTVLDGFDTGEYSGARKFGGLKTNAFKFYYNTGYFQFV